MMDMNATYSEFDIVGTVMEKNSGDFDGNKYWNATVGFSMGNHKFSMKSQQEFDSFPNEDQNVRVTGRIMQTSKGVRLKILEVELLNEDGSSRKKASQKQPA